MHVPDIHIRHIDSLLAERIRSLAKERQWSIDDVVLNALRNGLGMRTAGQVFTETMLDADHLMLDGQWNAKEQAAFQEAMQALAVTRPTRLAPDRDA
jgi:hypothetical protein